MAPELPAWLPGWCEAELGAAPERLLLAGATMSSVFGLRLADGRSVVVKARPDENGRAASCVAAQRAVAERGFPCAPPLTEVSLVDGLAVHAEEWRPGGELVRDDGVDAARRSAGLFAELLALLEDVAVAPPLPNPEWVRWDHADPADVRAAAVELPGYLVETAHRARARLARADLPCRLGHVDWEAQNLRWVGDSPCTVHDWDSLAWLPRAALVGVASGEFASLEIPTLAPLEGSAAFLDEVEHVYGHAFTDDEREVAWAASLWPALHNARTQLLHRHGKPLAAEALRVQAARRLALAGA